MLMDDVCLSLYTFLLLITFSGGHFDFSELNSIHYGIEILGTPIIQSENVPTGVVMMTSIYGQQYQCSYPDQEAESLREKEEEKAAEELGISHLLKPMITSPCLIHTKDWWTYEFCYGKYIRQYHVENGKPSGEIINLGLYESEFDWNNETEQTKKVRTNRRLNRYHSQQYVNGSLCDLTGKPRRAEVRFMCEDGVGDYVSRIDETSTCVYILTVHTTKICHHPYLKPMAIKKPLAITCNPLLSAEEYEEYQAHIEAQKARRQSFVREAYVNLDDPGSIERSIEEQTKKWTELKKQEQALRDAKQNDLENELAAEGSKPEEEEEENSDDNTVNQLIDELQKVLIESLAKELQGHFDKIETGEIDDSEINLETIDDDVEDEFYEPDNVKSETIEGESLRKTFSHLEEGHVTTEGGQVPTDSEVTRVKLQQTVKDNDDVVAMEMKDEKLYANEDESHDQDEDVAIETEEEDEEITEEFDKGLADLKRQRRLERIAKYRETLNSAMQAQFSNIVDEAQQELQRDGVEGEVNKQVAFKQLANTLSKLLNRLERTEEDIQSLEEKIASKVKQAEQLKKETAELKKQEDEETDYEDIESNQEFENENTESVENNENIQTNTDAAEHTEDTTDDTEDTSTENTEGTKLTDRQVLRENRVKVRITRLKQSPEDSKDTDTITGSSATQLKLHPDQKEKLENSVQQELQKAGLDTRGGKVEVRIITAGYYNTDDDSLHILSDEDSTAFNRMIVNFLGSSAAEEKENERQKALQDNYGFTWKKNKKSKVIPTE